MIFFYFGNSLFLLYALHATYFVFNDGIEGINTVFLRESLFLNGFRHLCLWLDTKIKRLLLNSGTEQPCCFTTPYKQSDVQMAVQNGWIHDFGLSYFKDVGKARLGLLETDWSISLTPLCSLHKSAVCETLSECISGRAFACLEFRCIAFVFRPNYSHKISLYFPYVELSSSSLCLLP